MAGVVSSTRKATLSDKILMGHHTKFCVVMVLASLSLVAQGTERIEAGAAACSSCHDMDSTGKQSGNIPSLAGQSAMALTEKLIAYRTGTLDATVMTRIARGFEESELLAIAKAIAEP